MQEVIDFFARLFSPEGFPPRWYCGRWTPFHGWLYITSNILIALAYFSIPLMLFYVIKKTKNKLPFQKIFWLFLLFILACGFTHVFDALMFWFPVYRVSAIVLFVTAIISGGAVIGLYKVLPAALKLKSPIELEGIIEERTKALAINNQSLLKLNTELEASQKLSEELLTQKDEFISIASHEMKTPLTTAKGYIELLQLSLTGENQTALYVTKVHQAVERLHDLVTELLDVSKIQNGELNYDISTFDFNQLVEETIENFQLNAQDHLIEKIGNASQPVTGDRNRLQQVLINLLSNAVKYSPKSGKVLVSIEEKDSLIQVSVKDFGIGMSEQHLDKIFEKYYRVQEHAIHYQGLGIGLYISKNIIERHNGTMWAESSSENGSIFHYTIPLNIFK